MARIDGPPSDRNPGLGDEFLTPINRDPVTLIKVVPGGPTGTGRARIQVPIGSQRIVTKVSIMFVPDDPAQLVFNLRTQTDARLWLAVRDRIRNGKDGQLLGVRNILGSQANPLPIPAPFEAAVDALGLQGHAESFGGPGVILEQAFLAGGSRGNLTPTGIFDEVVGELSVTPLVGIICPPGQWLLQTRWEPYTAMTPREWSQIKSLLWPKPGDQTTVATFAQAPP